MPSASKMPEEASRAHPSILPLPCNAEGHFGGGTGGLSVLCVPTRRGAPGGPPQAPSPLLVVELTLAENLQILILRKSHKSRESKDFRFISC